MCEYCGTKAGYTLLTARGSGGAYYRLKCKQCTMPILSEVMLICDSYVTKRVPHISYDSKYLVYDEEYIREVIKEDHYGNTMRKL